MKYLLPLGALLLGSASPLPAKPFDYESKAVVRLECGDAVGTAFKIGEKEYITATHVVAAAGNCTIDGNEVTDVRREPGLDFTRFTGPANPAVLKYSCRPYTPGEHYVAVGHAFGAFYVTYEPLIASEFIQDGKQTFVGEIIPGMSGGPVIDRKGVVFGITNQRWPARSIPLRDTSVCKKG